jgi:ribosomal protein L37AE/L43A
MNDPIVRKRAINVGFSNLRVTKAQYPCGHIIKYRTEEQEWSNVGECPYCDGDGSLEGKNPEYNLPENYPPFDKNKYTETRLDEIEGEGGGECEQCGADYGGSTMREHLEEERYYECPECGSEADLSEAHSSHVYDCPMCGDYETADQQFENVGDWGAVAAHLMEQGVGDGKDAESIGVNRLASMANEHDSKGGLDDMPNIRGKPSVGQLKERGKLRREGKNWEDVWGGDLEAPYDEEKDSFHFPSEQRKN